MMDMGADFLWFKRYTPTKEGYSIQIDEENGMTNHSYGGIGSVVDWLKTQGIDFFEYVEYAEHPEEMRQPELLPKQKEFLKKLESLNLPTASNAVKMPTKSDKESAEYVSDWIMTWITKLREGFYIAYSL